MQSLNRNGVSITQTPGEEKFVKCRLSAFKGQTFYQYDYRHTGMELFYGKKIIMESQRLIIPCNQLDIPITLHFGFP